MKKTKNIEHFVYNSLLRIEGTQGMPPKPFEKPSDKYDFWVLELTGMPYLTLPKWQKRVLPILRRHMKRMRQWRKSGMCFFLHVQTESPIGMLPAVFEPSLLKALSLIDCTLEHGVEIDTEKEKRSRTKRPTVRREARRP